MSATPRKRNEPKCEVYMGDGVNKYGEDEYYTCNNKPVVAHIGSDKGGVDVCSYHLERRRGIILGWWQDP